jgi:hypothetical protein
MLITIHQIANQSMSEFKRWRFQSFGQSKSFAFNSTPYCLQKAFGIKLETNWPTGFARSRQSRSLVELVVRQS